MTTIAADRHMMACDSQTTSQGGTKGSTRKVHRVGEYLVGFAGSLPNCIQFLNWFKEGSLDPEDGPNMEGVEALVPSKDGLWLFTESLHPLPITQSFAAIGSGEQAALGAMYAGASPKEAVKIASKIDCFTGGPIKTYALP